MLSNESPPELASICRQCLNSVFRSLHDRLIEPSSKRQYIVRDNANSAGEWSRHFLLVGADVGLESNEVT